MSGTRRMSSAGGTHSPGLGLRIPRLQRPAGPARRPAGPSRRTAAASTVPRMRRRWARAKHTAIRRLRRRSRRWSSRAAGPASKGRAACCMRNSSGQTPAWRGACGRGQSAETHPDELDQGQRRPDLCCGARARVRQQRVRGAGGRPYEQIALGAGSMRSGGLCSEAGKE